MALHPKKYQVFVSSTYRDLVKERQDTIKAIIDLGHLPSGMEGFPAIDVEQFEYIKRVIDQCDYYILIVGDRYGSVAPDGMSFTEKEYRYALATGQVVLAFVKDPPDAGQSDGHDEKLRAFRKEVMAIRMVHQWNAGDDLKYPVSRSLREQFEHQPRIGWVRADQTNSFSPRNAALSSGNWSQAVFSVPAMVLATVGAVAVYLLVQSNSPGHQPTSQIPNNKNSSEVIATAPQPPSPPAKPASPPPLSAEVRVSRDREHGFQRIVSNDFRGS
jgi:hypothetical protein